MKIEIIKSIGNLKSGEIRNIEEKFAKNLIQLKFAKIYKEKKIKKETDE